MHDVDLPHHIPIPTAGRRSHDVLVEGERNEHDDAQQVHDSTHGAHGLRDLLLVHLAHILALQARLHERWSQPADHGIGGRKGNAAEGQRGDQRLAVAGEGVGYYADTC